MKLAVGIKMLDFIATKNPNLAVSPAYVEAEQILHKDPAAIDYKEKMELLDKLEALCIVAGVSYGRLLEKAFEEVEGK